MVILGAVLAVALVVAGGAVWVVYLVVQTHQAETPVGAAGSLVGAVGVVKEADGMAGQALIDGARWQVVSTTRLWAGMRVRVVHLDGLVASVQPADHPMGIAAG